MAATPVAASQGERYMAKIGDLGLLVVSGQELAAHRARQEEGSGACGAQGLKGQGSGAPLE